MERLDRPLVFHQPGGEIVQQFLMGRPRPVAAEVTGSLHDAAAEMMLPDSVDDDARSERVARVRDPLRQFQTAAALREWLGFAGAQNRRQMPRHDVAAI